MKRDLAVCVHEGAHIVTATALGQNPTEAKVWPIGKCSENGEQGIARYRYAPGCQVQTKIAITSAGPLAKLRFDPLSDPGWEGDAAKIMQLANDDDGAHVQTMAGCELARKTVDAHWTTIMHVASELMTNGTISGDKVKQLIRQAATATPTPKVNSAGAGSLLPDSGRLSITGVATVYSRPTWDHAMRGLAIKFLPGCFAEFLGTQPDVALQSFHNGESVIARTMNGSLQVWESGANVCFTADLLDTADGRSLYEKVRAGLLDECSIGLKVSREEDATWTMLDDETPLMTVRRGAFDEVSVVRSGAMKGTSVRSLRSGERGMQQQTRPAAVFVGRAPTVQENQDRLDAARAGLDVNEFRRRSEIAAEMRALELRRLKSEIADYRRT